MGVISKVEHWCAGIPKKSGAVRICVDLKPLNESVLQEVHSIPKVDDVLGNLAGATVFSKLVANSVFWQIPLTADSQLLTTFKRLLALTSCILVFLVPLNSSKSE